MGEIESADLRGPGEPDRSLPGAMPPSLFHRKILPSEGGIMDQHVRALCELGQHRVDALLRGFRIGGQDDGPAGVPKPATKAPLRMAERAGRDLHPPQGQFSRRECAESFNRRRIPEVEGMVFSGHQSAEVFRRFLRRGR